MIRFAFPVVALCAVLSSADGQDLKIIPPKHPPALPKDGEYPTTEWTLSWGLRDDKTMTMGGNIYKSLTEARAAAARRMADRGEPGSFWYVKLVELEGENWPVPLAKLPPARARLWKSIQKGLDEDRATRGCNYLVRDVASAAGVPGLDGKKADEMWGYFNTAAAKDGWVEVKGERAKGATPAVSSIEAANRLAEEGYLVVGVINKESLNKYKDDERIKEYGEGHVFVVTPTGGTDWTNTLTANEVLNGGPGTYTLANKVIATPKQHDAVQFFAIPLAKK